MTSKDIKRLLPGQLVEEFGEKVERAQVSDEAVRREVAKGRDTSPTGAPRELPPKKSAWLGCARLAVA